jgi:serine/threonine protein kinase
MPRFRIGTHIGSGGFGTVEEATLIDDDGDELEDGLAQKKLLPEWENDAQALARFQREVRMLTEMEHPNILPVVGRNLAAKPPWFIMPRAETNLADEIKAGRHGEESWVIKVYGAVLSGMTYAHGMERIHRDLKPENILIVNGVAMISDFGLGKRLDTNTAHLTSTHIGMGTIAYMAPEQFEDASQVRQPADVYALGKILAEMLCGKPPKVGPPRLDAVPSKYHSFIEKCCMDDPDERYASAADAQAAFRLLVSPDLSNGPAEGSLEDLLHRWEEAPEGQDADIVKTIADFLVHERSDEELLYRAFPRVPDLLIEQLLDDHPEAFDLVLKTYDNYVSGALPFDYCDVVANFYRRVYRNTTSEVHRRLILERLVRLGPSHNRWHVGEVVGSLLAEIAEKPEADMAADVLSQGDARWFEPYARNRKLLSPIAKVFRPPEDDDIPF